jgi:hypothetical protein
MRRVICLEISAVRKKHHFCHLLNLHEVNDFRLTEIHTAEPLIPEHSDFEVEMAIEKLKRYK